MEKRMVTFYVSLLVFVIHASAQERAPEGPQNLNVLRRNDAECAQPEKRVNLPQCDWHYIAYFPRIFRSGVTENVNFATHGFPNNVEVTLKVVDTRNRHITQANQTIEPGKLVTIPVLIPHKVQRRVKVIITGSGQYGTDKEWVFTNKSEEIRVEKLGLSILIQTDRPLYKPGQLIRSRVIVIDSKLKPYNGKLDSVVIENPSGSIMRKWKDVELEEGFASFELKTSVKPVLGKWRIKARAKHYKKTLDISVTKYVLPKFQVTMKPPSFVTQMMTSTTAEVCAKYSYGKNVEGKLNATVCLEKKSGYYYSSRWDKKQQVECINFNKKIHGCATLDINLAKMKSKFVEVPKPKSSYRFYYSSPSYYLNFRSAIVTETATGVQLKSSSTKKQLQYRDVELSIESKSVFKPGFPLSVKLIAKRPDGTPVKSVDVKLEVTCSGIDQPLMNERKITITNGVKETQLPEIPFSARNVRVNIAYTRRELYKKESSWRRMSENTKYLTPWYSPSHSYLDVKQVKQPVKIGEEMEVTIGYTSVDTMPTERKISYSMMCGGNLVASDTFTATFIAAVPRLIRSTTEAPTTAAPTTMSTKVNVTKQLKKILIPDYWWWRGPSATRPPLPYQFSTGNFKFSVKITRDMLPSCRMVVYYIRQEEVIADETSIKVVNEFENQMTMQFDKKEVRPGKPVKLTVKGAPSSRIAVAAIDKSIHFLAKGNDIKPEKLVDIREKLTIRPGYVSDWDRCPRRWRARQRRSSPPWGGWYGSSDFVDSQKAFANAGVLFLTTLRVDVRPCKGGWYEDEDVEYYPFESAPDGPIADSGGIRRKKPPTAKAKATRVRTEFPETWLWTDERLSENGSRVFDVTVPDTITSWYASGFGLSKSAGLGVANPTELRAFQPFFVSLTLPYSVIRGEDVTITAAVFSYHENSCMTVRITLVDNPLDYEMVTGRSGKACLCSGRTATQLFRIKPKKLGYIDIRVRAESLPDNICAENKPFTAEVITADILVKKLLVEAEGTKDEYTRSTFFCPSNEPGKNFTTKLDLVLPENLVPGSLFARVEAMGDIMGSSLSNVDELLAMPYGCGEQNMLKFAPNIFIMNYLNNTNQVNAEITTKALDYMRTGYQRELTYKHNDGSYSAFGKRDKEGSTWLSAFVLKSYAQARSWIDVDEKEIRATANWLIKSQNKDGCYPKIGHVHNKAMKGGVKNEATLSAYVVIAMLEAGYNSNHVPIVGGAYCARKALKDSGADLDSYSLSIMAYLFAKLQDKSIYDKVMKYLDQKAINKDGMIHWEEEKKEKKDSEYVPWYYKARSTDIEQTSYVLLAKIAAGGKSAIPEVVPIVRWLSKQRNSLGGWSSTQDTVLAMQALAEFAELTFSPGANMQVLVQGGDIDHNFVINADNKLILQRVEDVSVPSSLSVYGTGEGCALIQANVKYNVQKVVSKPTFVVDLKIESISNTLDKDKSCRSQNLKVCTSWAGKGEESNMAIIDVQMISGFTADEDQFDEILRTDKLNLKDIEVKEKSVVFYIRKIAKISQCVTFRVDQTNNVRETKDAPIKVYDYYDTEKSTTTMYKFTEQHCGVKK